MRDSYSRTIRFGSFVLLLACCCGARAQSSQGGPLEWHDFKSDAGGFSVKFPGIPKIGQAPFTKGPITTTRYTHSLSVGQDLNFEMEYMDSASNDPDLSLEGGISGLIRALTATGATLLTKETVVRGSCEGRDATLAVANPGHKPGFGQGRIFNSGQRYYFMVFIGTQDTPATREIARTFVESFTITGGCNNLVAPVEAQPAAETVASEETVEGSLDAATGWRSIESTELGFRVLMPAVIKHQTDQGQTKPFPLTHHTYIHSGNGSVYSAEVFSEYPPNFRNGEVSYQTGIDLTLYSLQKNLEPDGFVFKPLRDLRVGKFPGREFSLTSEKIDAQGRAQIYVTAKRIYIFIGFAHDQGVAVKLLKSFFDSIRVSSR